MKIEGSFTETKRVKFNVDPWEVFYGLREQAYKKTGIEEYGAYLSKDGTQIMYEEEIQTSHTSYYERVLIEKPTSLQLDVIRDFENLRTTLGKLDL